MLSRDQNTHRRTGHVYLTVVGVTGSAAMAWKVGVARSSSHIEQSIGEGGGISVSAVAVVERQRSWAAGISN